MKEALSAHTGKPRLGKSLDQVTRELVQKHPHFRGELNLARRRLRESLEQVWDKATTGDLDMNDEIETVPAGSAGKQCCHCLLRPLGGGTVGCSGFGTSFGGVGPLLHQLLAEQRKTNRLLESLTEWPQDSGLTEQVLPQKQSPVERDIRDVIRVAESDGNGFGRHGIMVYTRKDGGRSMSLLGERTGHAEAAALLTGALSYIEQQDPLGPLPTSARDE